ncbi:MFS transporter [Marinicrinis lubricantis]|uniref:MFS transporter n=1 Tax=Marinicrinis lubricantis TaxID=2086470 RepID=A0ABW1IQJ0_9BACL
MKRQLGTIMILLITVFLGFAIIIPIVPELIEEQDAGAIHLGLLLAIYSAVSFFMSPIWGKISDRVGRKPIMMIGTIGFSASFFIFGIGTESLPLMYVSRILGGMFSGAVTSCAVAYVADITSEENRTKGMGLVGMSIGTGFVFGPVIGGLLSGLGNAVPFFVSAGLALLLFVFVARFLTESLPPERRTQKGAPKVSRWTAFAGPMKFLYILGFIIAFTMAGLESTFQLFQSQRIGADAFDVGIMLGISGVIGALIQGGIIRRYVKKGDENKFILVGLILSSVGFFLLLLSDSFVTATIYLCVFSSGNALLRPCITSLITQKTRVSQGIASGLSSSMDSLGRIFGPLLATGLFHFEIGLPFVVGGVVCILGLGLLYGYMQVMRKEERTAAS